MTTVPGLDVSYWQSEIDWADVRAAGRRFVFLKATEGLSYTDPTFARNWQNARSAGMLRGAYGFFHPDQDPRQQARRFINTIKDIKDNGELPCSIDLEVTDSISNQKIISGAKIWLDEVELAFGRKPMIYSGVSFLETSFADQGGPPAWAGDYALWLGWFPDRYQPGMSPLMPRGWTGWTFWQYSGKGSINGIPTEVDLDLFNGSLDQLQALAEAGPATPKPTTHLVAAGDSFQSIADRYCVSLGALMAANPQLLKVGDILHIPVQTPTPLPPGPAPATYTVKAGDTLSAIAAKYSTSVSAIAAKNKIQNPNLIQVGQVLAIA